MPPSLTTDLLTPLGAYLRLREARRAPRSCSSPSTRAASAGTRSSAAATADRSFEEAESLDEPVVGYLGYDHIAKLEPTVPLPDAGPDVPESRFIVADVFLRFDHVAGTAEVIARRSGDVVAALLARTVDPPADAGARGGPSASPTRPSTSAESSRCRSTSAAATRSRSSSRSGPSGRRAPRRSPSTARSAASIRRRTSSCSSSASSRSSAHRPRRT